jgi:WD40 repeat protein
MTIEEALDVLDTVLQKVRLNDTQEAVFCEAWAGKTFPQIAAELNFTEEYVRAVGADLWHLLSEALGEKVTKRNFKGIIERWVRRNWSIAQPSTFSGRSQSQDWGEAVDVSTFFGRTNELATLERWIVTDRCRLVALLGMGGIGKTSLSIKVAQKIQAEFDYLIWRSLRNAPPIQELLTSLLHFLSDGAVTLPAEVSGQLSLLLNYLRERRCLIILDNVEMILNSSHAASASGGQHAGHYRAGYEAYGELWRCVGEIPHQSCLMLTSREKPREIDLQAGATEPVRSMQLRGLNSTEAQEIFQLRGQFLASATDWNRLIHHYAGNPLALKIVASTIQDLFDSDVARFLHLLDQGTVAFDDIRDLISGQIDRLSEDEAEVMYWLAIHRELISFTELQEDIVSPMLKWRLPEVLRSLGRRFLIERSPKGFTQQPVVMEYVIEQFIEQVGQEICAEKLHLLMNHALIKAQTKSYIRESQVRIILTSIADRLCDLLKSPKQVELKLKRILATLKIEYADAPGYAAGNLINLLHQLAIDLTGYDFSHLAVWQAYLQGVSLHQVNFAAADLSKSVFTETLGNVWTVAFSADGQLLAAGDTVNEVHLWQVADAHFCVNPQKLLTCHGHTNWVSCLAFHPNGKLLASGSADNTVKLWDTRTGQCLRTLAGHTDWVLAVAIDPTRNLIATGSADGSVKVWEVSTGQCVQTLIGHTNWVRSVVFLPCPEPANPAESILVSGSGDDTIRLWRMSDGKCVQIISANSGGIWSIAPAPDGKTLISGGADTTVKLWNLASGQCERLLSGHSSHVRSVSYCQEGQRLISASEDQTIQIWDAASGDCLKTLSGHTSAVWSVACTHHARLASGSLDQRVKLWDLRSGQCLSTLQGYTDFIWATAIAPQFSAPADALPLLASGSTDHTIKLWNLLTGECLRSLQGHTNWVLSVAFSPDGKILASSSFDQTIRLWDWASGRCGQILRGHTNWVLSVAFSPDGKTLASASFDQTVKLWDTHTGECLHTFSGHEGRLWSVAFSPDGRWIASSGDDAVIRLWDRQAGKCVRTLTGHSGRIWSIAFSPNGEWLISGGQDQILHLWQVSTGNCLHRLSGHTDRIQSVAFSLKGTQIASGSADQTVKLWDAHTGTCLHTLTAHTSRVWSVVFGWLPTADDRSTQILASGSEDETIRLWDTTTGTCLRTLQGPRPYHGMNITGVTGLTDAQKATLKALGAVEINDRAG